MRAVLPGKPRATKHAVCTARWKERRIVVYISGSAIMILDRPDHLLQTIYHDEADLLDAVAIDEASGKIAVVSKSMVFVYKPYGWEDGVLKWSLQGAFDSAIPKGHECGAGDGDGAGVVHHTVSWGTGEELLVGAGALRLFQTGGSEEKLIWEKRLPSAAETAVFSPDAALIATSGRYDRLVKIWRRLSFGNDEVDFDFGYLAHPAVVTGLQWRRTDDRMHEIQHVLYTVCADRKVRVWAAVGQHGLSVLQLWTEIDLEESIQPRYLEPQSTGIERFVFFMSAGEFRGTVGKALDSATRMGGRPILEHLLDLSEGEPEVCVVMDGKGHMCAWGMQNVGRKGKVETDVFNVALVENFDVGLLNQGEGEDWFLSVVNFSSRERPSRYCVLVHRIGGGIAWLEGGVDEFFDPSPRQARLHALGLWTGHEGPIKKINRTHGGRAIISRTNDNEGSIWKQAQRTERAVLAQHCSLVSEEHIHRTSLLSGGNFVANLHHHGISLWDATGSKAEQVASCEYEVEGKPLCLLQLPFQEYLPSYRYLATVSSKMNGIVWEIRLPHGEMGPSMNQYCTFSLGDEDDLSYVLPIDPAGSKPVVSGFLDVFAKDVALSYSKKGVLSTWTTKLNMDQKSIDWLATAIVQTGVENPTLASGSSIRKIALVDATRDGLTIWDTRDSQLEYEKQFGTADTIQDLDWTSTPDDQSILAVGFPHKVMILAQIRYDYLDRGTAWAPVREIFIRELTPHPIGDSTWLGNGNLVIGAGNQLLMYDKLISTADEMVSEFTISTHQHKSFDLFDLVSILNGPLPLFHPQLLAQCILAGKLALVQKIIVNLHKSFKFYSDGDELDSSTLMPAENFFESWESHATGPKKDGRSYADDADDEETDSVTEELALSLNEDLAKKSVPYLSSREQFHLADLVECVATAEKHRRSMDENATRFLLFFRQHMLRKAQAPERYRSVSWREFAWAYHSGSQDILVDLVSRHFSGKMLWEHARESGMFMWMTDLTALRAQFEVIARNEYTKTYEKNPIDCSLYYLALKKKNVLVGLWRMASWHREQPGTQRLLANNFSEPRWKTAALKNAYALLGKRRFEYAAAFFLLAGNLRDAVSICCNQMQDLQLAIAVARVYAGEESPVLRELLEEKVLPRAATDGNRWMAMWAFWMLGRRDMAVRSLITPVHALLDRPQTPSQEAKSYLATDPALVVLYKQLRDKSLQTLKGATEITPRAEWEFVIQIARLYDRMGCDLLAIDLVRNWEFLKQVPPAKKTANDMPDPRMLLRRRSSLVVADLPVPTSPTAVKAAALKPPPTMFEEPASNSLLDSFGF